MNKIKEQAMSKFTNANIYYDGSVTSCSVELEDGSEISLGIMLPGEEWKTLNTPKTFNVATNESFDVIVKTVTNYCCSYID